MGLVLARPLLVNLYCGETGISRDDDLNTMAAGALALRVAMPLATMTFTV